MQTLEITDCAGALRVAGVHSVRIEDRTREERLDLPPSFIIVRERHLPTMIIRLADPLATVPA